MVNPRLITLAEKLGSEVLPKQEAPDPTPDPVIEPKVLNTKDYIVLENIVCRDAEGKVFEQYPTTLCEEGYREGRQPKPN